MFRRINALHSLISVRNYAVKITQKYPEKVSKADRIKKLHFENKYMFGTKIKEKKLKPHDDPPVAIDKSNNDISSEIYWTCLHVPEVQDFTKRSSKRKPANPKKETKPKLNKKSDEDVVETEAKVKTHQQAKIQHKAPVKVDKSNENIPLKAKKEKILKEKVVIETPPKRRVKRTYKERTTRVVVKIPQLPETLKILQENLPEVRAEIKQSLDTIFGLKPIRFVKAVGDRDIPFETYQLREITQFPYTMAAVGTLSVFDRYVPEQSSLYLPSVSKVLQGTMPEAQRQALIQWKTIKISELGIEGFERMQQSHFNRGKQFHQCLQDHFNGKTVITSDIEPEVLPIWKSVEPLLVDFKAPGVFIEEKVNHPFLLYQGIVDCVSYHNSTQCLSVIEWKKSDRHKKSIQFTYDAPLQLVSYLGALNTSREEFYLNPIKNGAVVVAYNDGTKADVFRLNEADVKKYWKLWLHRLQEYWIRYRENTLSEPI